jgi:DNA (cytosine-5)-methyltransferase 1
MRHGSLFSGIGGFDLASEWMGWENLFHCEWNEFGQKVLKYYWPKAITYHDITKTDFSINRGTIDILTGGFPCQPYSTAGKRLGKEDERHLWPEMLRAIREIQPTYVVGENVLGLTNWNGGLVFEEVQADLEAQGYEVQAYVLPAASVNAPHLRQRVFFVAYNATYSNLFRCNECFKSDEINTSKGRINALSNFDQSDGNGFIANSDGNRSTQFAKNNESKGQSGYIEEQKEWTQHSKQYNELFGFQSNASDSELEGLQRQRRERKGCSEHRSDEGLLIGAKDKLISTDSNGFGLRREINGIGESRLINKKSKANYWRDFPTQSPICNGNDGISSRLDGITFPKWRQESIKAGGNAIVPQVVYQIFKAIDKYNQLNNQLTL